MILVVYRSVFPDATPASLLETSLAIDVKEKEDGVLHMEYESISDFVRDPVAQRIANAQRPAAIRRYRHLCAYR
nr:hypothetical protein TetV2_00291 [Oceanusvirus sp.]